MCRESWKALGDMNQDVAKEQYLEWVQDLFEEFDVRGPKRWRSSSTSSSKATSESMSLDNSISMAGAVSMPKVDMYDLSCFVYQISGVPIAACMVLIGIFVGQHYNRSTEEWKVKDDVFHYASTGNLDKLVAALDHGEDINSQVSKITMHNLTLQWTEYQRYVLEMIIRALILIYANIVNRLGPRRPNHDALGC